MIVEQNNAEMSDFASKIIAGVRKAVRQVVETAAANDENLVVGDKDGNSKSVPAKELLKTFSK